MIDTNLVTDKDEQDYYNSLEPEIDRLVKLYNLPESPEYASIIVTFKFGFIEILLLMMILSDYRTGRICKNSTQFKKLIILLKSSTANKKVKINNDLNKTRLNYVVNASPEHEIRNDFSLDFPKSLYKDFALNQA